MPGIYPSTSVRSSNVSALLIQATRRVPRVMELSKNLNYQTIKQEYLTGLQRWKNEIGVSQNNDGNYKYEKICSDSKFAEIPAEKISINEGFELTRSITKALVDEAGVKVNASTEFLVSSCLAKIVPPMSAGFEDVIRKLLRGSPNGAEALLNWAEDNLVRERSLDFTDRNKDGSFSVSLKLFLKPASGANASDGATIEYKLNMKPDDWNEDGGNLIITPGVIHLSLPEDLRRSLGEPKERLLSRMYEWLKNFLSELPGIRYERVAMAADDSNAGLYHVVHTACLPLHQTVELPKLQAVENDFMGTCYQRTLEKRIVDEIKFQFALPQVPGHVINETVERGVAGVVGKKSLNAISTNIAKNTSSIKTFANIQTATDERINKLNTAIQGLEEKVDKGLEQINLRVTSDEVFDFIHSNRGAATNTQSDTSVGPGAREGIRRNFYWEPENS